MSVNSQTILLDAGVLTATFLLYQTSGDDEDKLIYYKRNHPSYSHLDWNQAEKWHSKLQPLIFDHYPSMCREACRIFLTENRLLLDLVCYGREMLLSNLTEDECQVFKSAHLLDKIPDEATIAWWDSFKTIARAHLNDKLLAQGRIAEKWTIEEELKKLKDVSINEKPEWVSVDSDRHGYDISSFKLVDGLVVPLLIEVKSFAQNTQPHIYVTANEWNRALKTVNTEYVFYVWSIESKIYKIFTPSDLLPHIPTNLGKGQWQTVRIQLEDF
jgi:hypothetical protein